MLGDSDQVQENSDLEVIDVMEEFDGMEDQMDDIQEQEEFEDTRQPQKQPTFSTSAI